MSKIEYRKGSLFEAPNGSFIVHACNCRGVWGSGIAKEFKEKFPKSFEEYNLFCKINDQTQSLPLGYSFITSENVVCLFTSNDYGVNVDKPYKILINTIFALDDFIGELLDKLLKEELDLPITIYSNKFNSGLFDVPWEQTEYALNKVLEQQNIIDKWIVYSQD